MIKAVIFDLNGVFIKSEPLSARFEEKYKVPVDEFLPVLKEIMDEVRKPDAPEAFDLWKPHLQKWGLELSEEELFDFWFSGEKLVPGLVHYVDELKSKGLKVFILSNNLKERTESYRKQFPDFFNKFDGAYFSWETGFVKPDPKAYEKILVENGLRPEECIYFDDSDKNVEVAISLGIQAEKYESFEATKTAIEKLTSPKVFKRK